MTEIMAGPAQVDVKKDERWKKHQCGGFYALQHLIIIKYYYYTSGPKNYINGK